MTSRRPSIFRDQGSEGGAILPLVALLLLVLVGFAAIGVDLGYRQVAQRQAQTAADTAVLAGAVNAFVESGNLQAAVNDALAVADANTGWDITTTDWQTCSDPDHLSFTATDLPGVALESECVSFSPAFDELRLKLPTKDLKTIFASVIGFNTLPVSASAQASLEPPSGQATPPFVVLPPGSAGQQVCLRTSNGASLPGQWIGNGPGTLPENIATLPLASEVGYVADPCDDFAGSSQFFGTLNPFFYEDANPSANPDTACQQVLSGIAVGIAEGVDHPLSSFEPDYDGIPAGPQVRLDGDGCPQGPAVPWPNTMALQTGFTAQTLRCGLLSSGGGNCANGPQLDGISYLARFKRGFHQTGSAKFAGESMENRPLWSFLKPGLTTGDVPDACIEVQQNASISSWDYFDKKERMIDCLLDFDEGDDAQLFDDSLFEAARFAIIPVVAESAFNVSEVHFNSFVPIFFQTLYQAGNESGNPDPMCWAQAEGATGNSGWYRHEAGQQFDCGRSQANVDRVAAIVLNCAMMSKEKCTPDPSPGPEGEIVYEVRLTQ